MRILVSSLAVVSCVFVSGVPIASGCTAFYASDGDLLLVGNNEDCPDSLAQAWAGTHMWFAPPEEGNYGWVCFGYGEGHPWGSYLPQGGMNEAGVFFDGFSTPFKEITESLDKPIYEGALAQKALDECSTVEEVLEVYDTYNLQAQYMEYCQMMFGDKFDDSAIVEGDSTIRIDGWYQVCTNFYQSCPELGGHPCWRYDTAVEMLGNSDGISVGFARTVLDAVHSEGASTTQYSIVYDLESGLFYVFHYHNFDEFIEVDLQIELGKGAASYELSSLFSDMRLLSPDDSATVSSSAVTFKWSGKPDCNYELHYSTDPAFAASTPVGMGRVSTDAVRGGAIGLVLLSLLPLRVFRGRKRRLAAGLMCVLVVANLMVSCELRGVKEQGDEEGAMSVTVESLESDTTYYWKVTAQATEHFTSESVVRTFTTAP